MDRNREARRATNMAAPSNGLSSSRRRHRSSSLRDSPDEDGGVELQEPGKLRDRGVVKKDRGDRDRDRERERSSRSKRRRENRMMSHHVTTGSNRDDGDDTSEESLNEEEEEEDDDAGNGGGSRMLPPPPANSSMAAAAMTSNHHNHNPYSQQIHHRKSFPSSANKVFRASAAAPPPVFKANDEMIGVLVPRKARSASTKRSHEWSSGGAVVGGSTATEQVHWQSSTSPVRLASSPAPLAPPSPSSSNVSVRKKMKANGGSKPRPPKSSSKSSSSNPEELEIEIAEVLYGLMTQSQAPSKKEIPFNDSTTKFDSNKSSSEAKSKVSSPTSNSTSLSTVAPKRKRPRQVSSPKTDISSSAVAAENGVSTSGHQASSAPSSEPAAEEEAKKESPAVLLHDVNSNAEAVIATVASTTTTHPKPANPETESQKEEKFEIDLMAPPPQQRTSQESDVDHKQMVTMTLQEPSKTKEEDKLKNGKEEQAILTEDQKKSRAGTVQETVESSKQAMSAELQLDFEKPNKDSSNRSLLSTKSESHTEKTAPPSSLPVPVSVASWPQMGYVAPLQGVMSMDGNTMPSTPIQPLFTHPKPKRCATHCYIARNIHYLQQFTKINPFWQSAASGSAAPMFGAKHCGPNVIPSTELHVNIPLSMQDKGQPVGIFPGHSMGKDTKSSQTTPVSDPAHRKQQVLLQHAMPPVAPNNMLHGPAFIFPFSQQQAVAASASVRPGLSKLSSSTMTGGLGAASGASSSAALSSSTTAAAAPALSFNYPNMSANETQYLAIVQNHPYAFPIPAVGAPPNYRGNHPHAQAMPLFNGSFYASQMMQPPQISQPPQQAPPPSQSQQTHQNSSGSTSSSHKLLLAQQRQQSGATAAANGGGSGNSGALHNSYPAAHKTRSQQQSQHMNPPAQARHLENEVAGGEDSPSTADSRVSRAATNSMSVYGHNFAMPVHSQNFTLMNPQGASATSNDKKQQQQSQQLVLKRGGAESSSSLPPQTFAMSFSPMNGASGTISSMTQNHIFQSLPESLRQSYHHMMSSPAAASAHFSEPKKDFRISEEATRTTGHDSSNADDDRKGSAGLTTKSGQSIAFSRPDLATDASGSSSAAIPGTSVIDSSSSRNINLGSNNRSTRSPISTSVAAAAAAAAAQSSHHLQVLQLQKQQQQQQHVRSKNPPPSNNGSGYPEHLSTSSSSMAAMFSNTQSSSPVQSPQWRNSVRASTASQVSSSLASTTTSSLKNIHQTHQPQPQPQQQPPSRSHPQSHTQISFGGATSQKLPPPQQQQQNQNPSSNSGNRCPSPPMLVGSPTSSLSSQPLKNTIGGTQRTSPSILGNPHNSNSTKSQQQQQQQLHKQTLQQQQAQSKTYAQMMYTQPYIVQQPHAQQHSVGSTAASGYYFPRKQQQQQQVSQQQASSSTATLTLANNITSDPAKAIAAATSNMKGGVGLGSQQGILHAAQYGGSAAAAAAPSSMPAGFPQYVHNAPPAAVQVKSTEQKQPAA